jgi:2-polyprenyl-6-methoxyphenol hydroxylase-like FAD-dependent oxidoreductase
MLSVSLERMQTKCRFIAFMSQSDVLDFITRQAMRCRTFALLRNAEVVDLVQKNGRVTGLRYRDPDGEHELAAVLTVGADGRSARAHEAAQLPRIETSPPIDVFWFRVPRHRDEPQAVAGGRPRHQRRDTGRCRRGQRALEASV